MFTVSTATWITITLLAPFWWGMGLLLLALLGDVVTAWHGPVSGLFDGLEGIHQAAVDRTGVVPDRRAA